jgi:hypothetical protein
MRAQTVDSPLSGSTWYERLLIRMDEFPAAALYRALVGYLLFPSFEALAGGTAPGWTIAVWFVAVLVMLRGAPAVVRRIVPFPAPVQTEWARRRQLAKRCDSYQWRKLLWLGIGELIYVVSSQHPRSWELIVTTFSLLGGAAGEWVWRSNPGRRR